MLAKTVLLATLLALSGVVVAAPGAAAMCYLDPEEPVPGVTCGVNRTVACVKGIVQHGACPI